MVHAAVESPSIDARFTIHSSGTSGTTTVRPLSGLDLRGNRGDVDRLGRRQLTARHREDDDRDDGQGHEQGGDEVAGVLARAVHPR